MKFIACSDIEVLVADYTAAILRAIFGMVLFIRCLKCWWSQVYTIRSVKIHYGSCVRAQGYKVKSLDVRRQHFSDKLYQKMPRN